VVGLSKIPMPIWARGRRKKTKQEPQEKMKKMGAGAAKKRRADLQGKRAVKEGKGKKGGEKSLLRTSRIQETRGIGLIAENKERLPERPRKRKTPGGVGNGLASKCLEKKKTSEKEKCSPTINKNNTS